MTAVVYVLAGIGLLTVVAALAYVEGYVEGLVGQWWQRRRCQP